MYLYALNYFGLVDCNGFMSFPVVVLILFFRSLFYALLFCFFILFFIMLTCRLPVASKCSLDSLSLQECLEELLISLFGLPAQLLFPLPPQSLPKATLNHKTDGNEARLGQQCGCSERALDIPGSVSSAAAPPHRTQTPA